MSRPKKLACFVHQDSFEVFGCVRLYVSKDAIACRLGVGTERSCSEPLSTVLTCLQREKGWTVEAVQQGASDLGLSRAAAGIFERPQGELVKVR